MKQANNNRKNILRGVSTLDEFCKNLRIVLLLPIIIVFGGSVRAGHSILDLVDPSFNPQILTNSFNTKKISSMVALPDGKILAAGEFNSFNRQPVGRLIRLKADGTLDTTFNNNQVLTFDPSGPPKSIVVQPDGKIILFGINITLNGQGATPTNIVRLNSDGSVDSGFSYGIGGNITSAAVDSGNRIAIAGNFQVNGTTRYLLRLNSDGSLDTSFTFTTPSPFYIKVATQGSRIIAAVALNNTMNIYRLNEDGTTDTSFSAAQLPSLSTFYMIVQPDDKILVMKSQAVIRLNANGANDNSFQQINFTTNSDPAFALADDGKIVLAIRNNSSNGTKISRYNSNGSSDSSFNFYTHPFFLSLAIQPGGSVVIGDETPSNSGGTNILNYYMRLLPNGSPDAAFNSGGIGFQMVVPGSIRSIGLQADGKILIAGKFDEINANARYKIARLNADSTLDTSFQTNTTATGNYFSQITQFYNARVQADGKIVATGNFTYILNGAAKSNLVRLNPDGSIDSTFNLGFTLPDYFPPNGAGTNKFVLFEGGGMIIGNSRIFPSVLPVKLTDRGAFDNSFNPTIYNTQNSVYIQDIALQPDGKIIIGGRYNTSVVAKSFIARLNADGSTDSTFQISEDVNREIAAFTLLPNGKILIVRGSANGTTPILSSEVLRLNADGSADNSFDAGTGANARINAILLLPTGKIFVGGKFTSFNGQPRQNLAQLNPNGSLNKTTYNLNDEVLSLAVDTDGRVLVGGSFTIIAVDGSGANRTYLARLIDSQQARRTRFDFDGDGRADLGVFSGLARTWSILNSQSSQPSSTLFGLNGDKIAPADFDGDGRADIAVYRPSDGNWYLLRSTDGSAVVRFGASGDKPVPADYDGDGKADIAVWRPSNGDWWILQSSNNQTFTVHFGLNGDIPMPDVDFDGDGKADIAVWRPTDGNFYWMASGEGNLTHVVHWGMQGDIPAPADYNGDGKADLVVFRPSEGNWYQFLSLPNGDYSYTVTRFGLEGDEPVAADYDGDGKTDIAIRRNGVWHLLLTGQGYTVITFGNPAAQAIPALPQEVTIARDFAID